MPHPLRTAGQLAAIALVVVGCCLVLLPFVSALLFAAVACIATWPLYRRLRIVLHGRAGWAALLMVGLLTLLVLGPSALLAVGLADGAARLLETAQAALAAGPIRPPGWLKELPLIGTRLDAHWRDLASGQDEAMALFRELLAPTRDLLLMLGGAIAESLLQLSFAVFIGYFFFRDGDLLVHGLRRALDRLVGVAGANLLETVGGTVTGVVHGVFGMALAQALVAWIGFTVAGVPGAFLLAAATFFFSLAPIGPPLLWGGASLWLFARGDTGWGFFMLVWGAVAISGIDNLVKPYLIGRDSDLPMLLIVLGVFGGTLAFGFIGLFIGPPLLAVGLILLRLWIAHPAAPPPPAA